MSFSENLARVVADQLARFVTLNRHQLAGHVANLPFWVAQARHALEVIDGYQQRFRRLKAGQADCRSPRQLSPDQLRRVPDASLHEARRLVADALYRFLLRLCNEELIAESQLRSLCEGLEIGIDPADLRRKHT